MLGLGEIGLGGEVTLETNLGRQIMSLTTYNHTRQSRFMLRVSRVGPGF